jgi:biopolymer transport protein TolR
VAMQLGGRSRLSSEINVTPLVDVVLVLLIIFMVVTPLLSRGKEVALPAAGNIDTEASTEPIVVSITSDGRLWLETSELADLRDAERRIAEQLEGSPHRAVLLKGDRELEVGQVRKVMQAARRAGARGVSLAVAEPTTGAE